VSWNATLAAKYRYPAKLDHISKNADVTPAPRSINDNRIYWRYFKVSHLFA
jgi:hypothetical protein